MAEKEQNDQWLDLYLTGAWSFATNNLALCVVRAQSDPYAPPSKIVLRLNNTFPGELWSGRTRQVTQTWPSCMKFKKKGDDADNVCFS
jgi:hypothetical protein